MVAGAEWEFRLSKPLDDGGNLREAFEAYRRDTGRTHPDDVCPFPVPPAVAYLLDWFWDLNMGRSASAGGYLGLSASEIVSWCKLRRVTFKPWELDAIRRLDARFLQVMAAKD